MTTPYVVPVTPATPQTVSISLVGVVYILTLSWCWASDCWMLSIADDETNPIVSSVPLVTGANLLEQFAYLGIGGNLVVQSDNDPDLVPTFTTLGDTAQLFFVTDP